MQFLCTLESGSILATSLMKRIIEIIKKNKKVSIPIIVILLIAIIIGSYLLIDRIIHPEYKDGGFYVREIGEYVGPMIPEVVFSADDARNETEYLGEYENYDRETDSGFLYTLFSDFASSNSQTELINNFLEYDFPRGEYVEDANGNKKSIGMNDKRFMLYFTDVFKDESGQLTTDIYGKSIIENKEALEEYFDMDVYILPLSADISKEDFLSVYTNGNYFNGSISKNFAEMLKLIDDKFAVSLYFNADGSLLMGMTGIPLDTAVDIIDLSLISDISIQECFPTLVKNYQAEYGEE